MKHLAITFVSILSLLLVSCQFTEEITFQKNGSGLYKLKIDMGELMSGLPSQDKDTVKAKEKIDSIIYIKDILDAYKDSINTLTPAEKAQLEAIKDMRIHMIVDDENSKMNMNFLLDFKDVSDLHNIKEKVELASKLQEKKNDTKTNLENHEVQYEFSKKKFARKVTMKDMSVEEQEAFDKQQENNQMFMKGSMYSLVYHFPRKIKSTTLKGAEISRDRKTLRYTIALDEIIQDPKLLDFTVKFK